MKVAGLFKNRREYVGALPGNVPEDALVPTLEWYGEQYDGGKNQLTLGFNYVILASAIDEQKVWDSLHATAGELGFVLDPNKGRGVADTFFFDLKGDGDFKPQPFIDRFTTHFYA